MRSSVAVEGEVDEGVVDDGGDGGAEAALGLLHHRGDLVAVTDVGPDRQGGVGVGIGQFAGGLGAAPVVDHHTGAFSEEGPDQMGAQPAGSTGDEDDLSVEGDRLCGGFGGGHRFPFCLAEKGAVHRGITAGGG